MPVELACEQCGNAFLAKPNEHRRFCSRACHHAHETTHGRPAARAIPVELACKNCGKAFHMKPAYLTEYRKKFGRDPLYCSRPCFANARHETTRAKSVFVCIQCGKTNPMRRYAAKGRTKYYSEQKFCNTACKANHQRESALARFNDGDLKKFVGKNGYVLISVPSLVTGVKHTITEHRYVMQKAIGRELLSEETVHHINGDRQDNRLANLELFSSRHGPGQRVADKVAFAIEILRLYPEFARDAGVALVDHISEPAAP